MATPLTLCYLLTEKTVQYWHDETVKKKTGLSNRKAIFGSFLPDTALCHIIVTASKAYHKGSHERVF